MTPPDRVVVHLRDRRPVFAFPPEAAAAVREAFPGWEVAEIEEPGDGRGDGGLALPGSVLEVLPGARVYLGHGTPPEVLEAGADLEWVHTTSAGVGSGLTPEMLRREVVFTNSAGIWAEPIAESAIGMLLYFRRGFDLASAAQREGRWAPEPFYAVGSGIGEIAGTTLGIIGYGGIGRAVARRGLALGMRVLALRRRAVEAGDAVEIVHGAEGFDRLLAESDSVVVAAPETEETRGLLGRAAIGRMRPGAVLVNVARGAVVDEKALVDALETGRLRGAGLDVFMEEPLPAEHPFWSLPNVLITPHVSGVSDRFWEREVALIVENARRFRAGVPLLNVVDKEAGY